jgi:hypothetical protein
MLLQFSLQVLKNHLMVEACLISWEISTLLQHFPLHPQPTILSLLAIVCFGFRNVQGIGGLLGNRKVWHFCHCFGHFVCSHDGFAIVSYMHSRANGTTLFLVPHKVLVAFGNFRPQG